MTDLRELLRAVRRDTLYALIHYSALVIVMIGVAAALSWLFR
jgi:hypothetical protein